MALNIGSRRLSARDTKLDRDVALKVLLQAFTDDRDRLARFEREAKVLASLNHPNIGHIYGLEEAEGTALEERSVPSRLGGRLDPEHGSIPHVGSQIQEPVGALLDVTDTLTKFR